MTMQAILEATGAYNQRHLAQLLGCPEDRVNQWAHRGQVSAEGAIAIEKLTKGKLLASKIRPPVS